MKSQNQKTILLVEDEVIIALSTAQLIRYFGYDVIIANSGEKALEIININTSIDLVLMDIDLGSGIIGTETAKSILKNHSIPIVFLTSHSDKETVDKVRGITRYGYIVKNSGDFVLQSSIEMAFELFENQNIIDKTYSKFKELANCVPGFIAFVNAETLKYEFVNRQFEIAFKVPIDKIVGSHIKDIIGESNYQYALKYIEYVRQGIPSSYVNTFNLTSGKKWVQVNYVPFFDKGGKVISIVVLSSDVTELKEAEEKVKILLKEKEILMKEVHHRIKNNMITIMSLLSLQSDTLTDKSAIAALTDAETRVQSMMILYDKLYRSSSFIETSSNEYFSTLIEEIVNIFPNKNRVSIEKKIENIVLDINKLFLIGILVNELITNIMKYAFKDRQDGLINISFFKTENIVTLIIQDNGVGLPESIDIERSTGFGFYLINLLTKQINASLKIERINGTKFIIDFDE